jgi:hypothetical protein
MPRFVFWVFLVAGLVGTVLLGLRTAISAYAGFRGPASPSMATADAAPERTWVRVEGLAPRCETRSTKDGVTFWLADGAKAPILVQRMGEVSCGPGPVDGAFLPGTFTRESLKDRIGLVLPPGEPVRVFTEALAPAIQRGIVYRALPFLVLCVALAAIGLRGVRQARAR